MDLWNMFASDFVAEETDAEEILSDEIAAEYCTPVLDIDAMVDAEVCVKQEQEEEEEGELETEEYYADGDVDGESGAGVGGGDGEIERESYFDNHNTAPPTPSASEVRRVPTTRKNVQDVDDDTIFNFGLEDSSATQIKVPKMKRTDFDCAMIYICPACSTEFDTQTAWKRHMNNSHAFNTRRGLNFVQIDHIYHRCLECNKRIAMHSIENLLKHKFTHLPFKCIRCKVCLRQYRYRQDLLLHLKLTHMEELNASSKTYQNFVRQERERSDEPNNYQHLQSSRVDQLRIENVQSNANDLYAAQSKSHSTEATAEQFADEFVLPSSPSLEQRRYEMPVKSSGRYTDSGASIGPEVNESNYEKYIKYICPECGMEYNYKSHWRTHIESVHNLNSLKNLYFRQMHTKQWAQCMECRKIVCNTINSLQQHKFIHMKHKSWLRCKLCSRKFEQHNLINKHLREKHSTTELFKDDAANVDQSSEYPPFAAKHASETTNDDEKLLCVSDKQIDANGRDIYDAHMDYLCPQCGREFSCRKSWRRHMVKTHRMNDMKVLNFRILSERELMCLECHKIITSVYGLQSARQHRITHMTYKAYIRCRLCQKSYTERKPLVKHLRTVHRIGMAEKQLAKPMSTYDAYAKQRHAAKTQNAYERHHQLQQRHRTQQPPKQQKEIVKFEDVVYEIRYLDDDE